MSFQCPTTTAVSSYREMNESQERKMAHSISKLPESQLSVCIFLLFYLMKFPLSSLTFDKYIFYFHGIRLLLTSLSTPGHWRNPSLSKPSLAPTCSYILMRNSRRKKEIASKSLGEERWPCTNLLCRFYYQRRWGREGTRLSEITSPKKPINTPSSH